MQGLGTIRPARYFGTTGWSVLDPNPIASLLTGDEDWDPAAMRLGWFEFSRIGHATPDVRSDPLQLLIFHRPDACNAEPRFLIEVSGNIGDTDEYVVVQDLHGLMTLLASWAPALQAIAPAPPIDAMQTGLASLAGLLAEK
jgi:hypothetical protein